MKPLSKYSSNTPSYKPARVLCYLFTLIAASLFQIAIADASAGLTPGDVVALDIGIGGDVGPEIVFRVDPVTGVRTTFQNLREIDPAAQVFSGGDIAVEQSGNILITESRLGPDGIEHALYRLDAATGERTRLTAFNFVSSDGKRKVSGIGNLAVEHSGSVLVFVGTMVQVNRPPPRTPRFLVGPSILYRVDPVSGIPTLLTDFARISGHNPKFGPTFIGQAVGVDPFGAPVVSVAALTPFQPGIASLYRINLTNGLPSFIANLPDEVNSYGFNRIEVEASGSILAVAPYVGNSNGKVYRFNQSTGLFSVLTDFSDGPFETYGFTPVDIALEASGEILVADMDASLSSFNQRGSVWRIHPKSGARSVLSDFGLEPQGLNPIAIAVVPERFVEFRKFNPILDIDVRSGHNDRFSLEAEITLGANTNGILPSEEIVTLRVGTYSVVLPAGTFKQMKHGNKEFHFRGKVNGVVLDVTLESEDANEYELTVFARGAKSRSVGNQVPVTLTIGNDRGSASVDTGKLCHNRDCK